MGEESTLGAHNQLTEPLKHTQNGVRVAVGMNLLIGWTGKILIEHLFSSHAFSYFSAQY